MKAEHRHELEDNSLAKAAGTLLERAKTGHLIGYKWLGLVAVVAAAWAGWWYYSKTTTAAASAEWTTFAEAKTPDEFTRLADATKNNVGKLARLGAARDLLGPQGLANLRVRDGEKRKTGAENVAKARDELLKIAEEFKGDKAVRGAALLDAADAELALVGIPKTYGGADYRGSVANAAKLYRQVAEIVGETTPTGEKLKKKADDLDARAIEILTVAKDLNDRMTPDPTPIVAPKDGPKPPDSIAPKPPEPPGTTPKDGPKPPDAIPTPAPPPTPTPGTPKDGPKEPPAVTPPPTPAPTPPAPTPPPAKEPEKK